MMISRILLFLTMVCSTGVNDARALEVRWLGVAGLSVTDGESTILLDPVFTKPTLRHWLFNAPFRTDPERVRDGLERAGIRRANAVFSSHGHFDHSVDVAEVSKLTGAVICGGVSLGRITGAGDQAGVTFRKIRDREEVIAGRFRVIPYLRDHPSILHLFGLKFLPGEVPPGFHFNFYDYHEGEVWGFRVEHPEGNLLIDQSSHFFEGNTAYSGKTDAYFVGVANRKSLESLVQGNILRVGSPLVVPLHFDFFLLKSRYLESLRLPGAGLEEIRDRIRGSSPGTSFLVPEKFRAIPVRSSAH
jgi:L-ascorbate metabolism protein UlaG (beta-lactamase superfamily)